MAESTSSKSYSSDPTIWLYTSLSSGSSQIVTATSRLETILKANRIPFKALDVATDEKARMLWGRRAGKRKLPGLVKMGMVIGDIDDVEEWNEYGELKEQVSAEVIQTPAPAISSVSNIPIKAAPVTAAMSAVSLSPSAEDSVAVASKSKADTPVIARSTSSISFAAEKTKSELQAGSGGVQASRSLAMRQLGHEAAARAKQNKSDALAARKAQVNAADEAGKLNTTETVSDSGTTNAAPAVVPEDVKIDELSNTELSPVAVGKENVPIATSSYATTGSDIATDRTFTTTKTSSSTASGAIFASSESPLLAPMEETTTNTEHTTSEGLSPQKAEFAISQLVLPSSVHILASQSEITTHRGSSIGTANKAEIKAIEEALKIPEEPEEEDQNPKDSNSIPNPDHHIRFAGEDKTEESNRVAAVTARTNSMIGEDSKATKQASSDSIQDKEKDAVTIQTKPETQQEVAADPTRVLESVED